MNLNVQKFIAVALCPTAYILADSISSLAVPGSHRITVSATCFSFEIFTCEKKKQKMSHLLIFNQFKKRHKMNFYTFTVYMT